MDDDQAALDPFSLTTEEQFVVALRRLRERSGLTFKEIERRTSAQGGSPLPSSTLATALHRKTVPRREVVAALVEVCDGDVARWLAARERLLHPMPAEPSAPPVQEESAPEQRDEAEPRDDAEPRGAQDGAAPSDGASPSDNPGSAEGTARSGQRRWRGRDIAVVTAVVTASVTASVTVAAIAAGAVPTRPQHTGASKAAPATSPAGPPSGSMLRLGGLCLSERPRDRTGLLFLSHCADSFPSRRLAREGTLWRVTTQHPDFGHGCMGVMDASFDPGTPVSDGTCTPVQTGLFTLRTLTGGIQLRPQDRDFCIGVKGVPAVRAPVLQLPCDERAPGQLFTIDAR